MIASGGYNAKGARLKAFVAMIALIAFMCFALHTYLQGSLVIRDADGVVQEVQLSNSEQQVLAKQLVGGLYIRFGTAALEGEAIVRCRNGREINYGYYTIATHIWRTIRIGDCAAAPTPSKT